MKLDRNVNRDGKGKYALLLMRKLKPSSPASVHKAIKLLTKHGLLDFGEVAHREFFVMRLKDAFAASALSVYSIAAYQVDQEYGAEILKLAVKSATHPGRRYPT